MCCSLRLAREAKLRVRPRGLELADQLKVLRQIQVQAEGRQLHDLEAGARPAGALAVTAEGIAAEVILDEVGRGEQQGIRALFVAVRRDDYHRRIHSALQQ